MMQQLKAPHINGIAATLSQCTLALSLKADDVLQIAAIGKIVTFKKGDTIMHAGDHPPGIYVVHSGLVKLFATAEPGNQRMEGIARPGMCIGLMSIIPNESTIAGSMALGPVKLIYFPREPLLELYKKIPELPQNVSKALSEYMRHLMARVQHMKGRTIEARLAAWLLEQPFKPLNDADNDAAVLDTLKKVRRKVEVVTMDISKTELARELSVTLQTLSRALSHFRKAGMLLTKRKNIYILNRAEIKELAAETLTPLRPIRSAAKTHRGRRPVQHA